VIWSSDERHMLLHLSGTTQLHLMALRTQSRSQPNYRQIYDSTQVRRSNSLYAAEEDDQVGVNMQTVIAMVTWSMRDKISKMLSYYTPPFCEPMLDQRPYIFSLRVPDIQQPPPMTFIQKYSLKDSRRQALD